MSSRGVAHGRPTARGQSSTNTPMIQKPNTPNITMCACATTQSVKWMIFWKVSVTWKAHWKQVIAYMTMPV